MSSNGTAHSHVSRLASFRSAGLQQEEVVHALHSPATRGHATSSRTLLQCSLPINLVYVFNMSATGTKKGVLEVFKFACYVSIPISMMALFANNPDNLEKVVRNRSYVVYPPEGPPLPPPEEIREMIKRGRADSCKDQI